MYLVNCHTAPFKILGANEQFVDPGDGRDHTLVVELQAVRADGEHQMRAYAQAQCEKEIWLSKIRRLAYEEQNDKLVLEERFRQDAAALRSVARDLRDELTREQHADRRTDRRGDLGHWSLLADVVEQSERRREAGGWPARRGQWFPCLMADPFAIIDGAGVQQGRVITIAAGLGSTRQGAAT